MEVNRGTCRRRARSLVNDCGRPPLSNRARYFAANQFSGFRARAFCLVHLPLFAPASLSCPAGCPALCVCVCVCVPRPRRQSKKRKRGSDLQRCCCCHDDSLPSRLSPIFNKGTTKKVCTCCEERRTDLGGSRHFACVVRLYCAVFHFFGGHPLRTASWTGKSLQGHPVHRTFNVSLLTHLIPAHGDTYLWAITNHLSLDRTDE